MFSRRFHNSPRLLPEGRQQAVYLGYNKYRAKKAESYPKQSLERIFIFTRFKKSFSLQRCKDSKIFRIRQV